MKRAGLPGPPPSAGVVLALSGRGGKRARGKFLGRLAALLPRLNWLSDVYVLAEGEAARQAAAFDVLRAASDHLARCKFAALRVRPLLTMSSAPAADLAIWERLASCAAPFQHEAYEHCAEPRLLLLPIIEVAARASPLAAASTACFLRERLMRPTLYFEGGPPPAAAAFQDGEIDVLVAPERDAGLSGVARAIRARHAFEGVLRRVEEGGADLLAPCGRLPVIDEEEGRCHACLARFESGAEDGGLDAAAALLDGRAAAPEAAGCRACVHAACADAEPSLAASGRLAEARQVFLRLGVACSRAGDHARGEENARRAVALAASGEERAAALLHQGLCLLSLGRPGAAEEAFAQGARGSADPGLFAFHRGRACFARQEDRAAAGFFESALRSPSREVPEGDVLYELALCRVRLEELAEARRLLERLLAAGRASAPVFLYLGVCDRGEGRSAAALDRFRQALALGPERADLARVRFFIGACLKDLERYDEAIAELSLAVAADPGDGAGHNLLGFCFYKTKRHAEAVACFRRALEIDPTSAIDHANLGSNLRDLGRTEEAIAAYETAHALDPRHAFARAPLARLREERGQ
ncbi:MAG: tetratricopeptide repeat protein [Planctomycetes bacterium]|nr:tetratricopeptide repeat protein [Planctomycetota bacterium]